MTDDTKNPGGWPDASKPGVPLNAEKDGWHWLRAAFGIAAPYPMLWSHDGKAWDTGDGWVFCTDPRMTERTRYLGPCLLPAEVAARVEQARAKALDEAAAWHDAQAVKNGEWREWGGPSDRGMQQREAHHKESAAAIRALKEQSHDR